MKIKESLETHEFNKDCDYPIDVDHTKLSLLPPQIQREDVTSLLTKQCTWVLRRSSREFYSLFTLHVFFTKGIFNLTISYDADKNAIITEVTDKAQIHVCNPKEDQDENKKLATLIKTILTELTEKRLLFLRSFLSPSLQRDEP